MQYQPLVNSSMNDGSLIDIVVVAKPPRKATVSIFYIQCG